MCDLEQPEPVAADDVVGRAELEPGIRHLAQHAARRRSVAATPAGQQALAARLEDRDSRAGPKMGPSLREVLRRRRNVVIRGRDEKQIHRLRDLEAVATHQQQPECRDPTIVGRAAQLIEGGLARVERVHDALRFDGPGEAEGEVPGAWTEIAHHHARPEIEGRDHRVWVAQAILARSAGVQPPANRPGQPVKGVIHRA